MTVRRLNVFFVHAQWLKDRERTISEFQKLTSKYQFKGIKGIKIRVITDYDPNDINGDIIGRTVSYNPIKDADDVPETEKLEFYNNFLKNIHIFQLSNSLKHYKILEEIAKESNDDDINLVLEDDVIYEDKMCMLLEKLINDLPSSHEMIFLGFPSNIDPQKRHLVKYQNVHEVFPRVLPYCDSYIVSKKTATKLYENYLPIKFVNNVQLSMIMEKTKTNGLIAIPNIFMDGSKIGAYLSLLTPNNLLLFNNDYMRVKATLNTPNENISKEDRKAIDKIMKDSQLNNHPDFMHLKALFLTREGKIKDAEKLYETALKIYQMNNCIINHESQFLKDYIRIYRDLQDDV